MTRKNNNLFNKNNYNKTIHSEIKHRDKNNKINL